MLLTLVQGCQTNITKRKKPDQKMFLVARAIQSSKFDKKMNNLVSGQFFTSFQHKFLYICLTLYDINLSYHAYQGFKNNATFYPILIVHSNLEILLQKSKTLVSGQNHHFYYLQTKPVLVLEICFIGPVLLLYVIA